MADYSKVISFIQQLYGSADFVPLSVPRFIGNEKNILKNASIPLLCRAWESL